MEASEGGNHGGCLRGLVRGVGPGGSDAVGPPSYHVGGTEYGGVRLTPNIWTSVCVT